MKVDISHLFEGEPLQDGSRAQEVFHEFIGRLGQNNFRRIDLSNL